MSAAVDWDNRSSVVAAVSRYQTIFSEEIMHALATSGELVVAAVIEKAPVSDGIFVSSVSSTAPTATQGGWRVDVGDNCNYGEVLEFGRKPGGRMPPVDALTPWVWSHRRFFPDVETEEDAQGVALNIARRIAARGFAPPHEKGWRMYEQAAADNGPAARQVAQVFARARKRIVKRCDKGA